MKLVGAVFILIVVSINACRSDVGNDNQNSPILSKIAPSSCIDQQKSAVKNTKADGSLEALVDFLLKETTEENKPPLCTKL